MHSITKKLRIFGGIALLILAGYFLLLNSQKKTLEIIILALAFLLGGVYPILKVIFLTEKKQKN